MCGKSAKHGPPGAVVVGRALGAVVHAGDAVDVPRAGRVAGRAHRQVEVVVAREVTGVGVLVEVHGQVEPAVGVRVVVAADVERERAERTGGTHDRRREAVELVQRQGLAHRSARAGVEDAHRTVHRLQDVAVPRAHTLVGRLTGERVAVVGQAGVTVVQTLERQLHLRVRLGPLARRRRRTTTGRQRRHLTRTRVAAQRTRPLLLAALELRRQHDALDLLTTRATSLSTRPTPSRRPGRTSPPRSHPGRAASRGGHRRTQSGQQESSRCRTHRQQPHSLHRHESPIRASQVVET